MTFNVFVCYLFVSTFALAAVVFKLKELLIKRANKKRKQKIETQKLVEICKKQERELIFYRNEMQTR